MEKPACHFVVRMLRRAASTTDARLDDNATKATGVNARDVPQHHTTPLPFTHATPTPLPHLSVFHIDVRISSLLRGRKSRARCSRGRQTNPKKHTGFFFFFPRIASRCVPRHIIPQPVCSSKATRTTEHATTLCTEPPPSCVHNPLL